MISGEGWWIDLNTGEALPVAEHTKAILNNPRRFRLDPREIARNIRGTARPDSLIELALKQGFARIRAHGSVVVEFNHKLEDVAAIVIPFLINNFDESTYVAFHDVAHKRQFADVRIGELEDQDRVNEIFGLVYERKKIKLSSLYEDNDLTPVGSKKYATGTERLVRGPKFGAGSGVKPPEHGNLSRISDVGSEPYSKDTIKPSEKPRKGSGHGHSSI